MNDLIDKLIRKMFLVEKFNDLHESERQFLTAYFNDTRVTHNSLDRYNHLLLEDEKLLPKMPNFTDEEKAYRRGYSHGVTNALMGTVTQEDVRKWISSGRLTGAPGTIFEDTELHGLVKDEEEKESPFSAFMPK